MLAALPILHYQIREYNKWPQNFVEGTNHVVYFQIQKFANLASVFHPSKCKDVHSKVTFENMKTPSL